ncbi:MAG: undecaprenyl-diphosphate phosphatase [Chlamydiae bacterium]|nr:undecaprenyl-diphosphate phosphatase [Chlamydiota bacterium]
MTTLHALILGIVQGLTEFFPVSSSAHLRLAKWLLGIPDGEHLLFFDLLCHSGTLLALILYLRKDILIALANIRTVVLFTLALTPLIPAYFLLKPVRIALSNPAYLGYFLIVTSVLLFVASKWAKTKDSSPPKLKDVLCIGSMQAMALIPGISRSGSTIATARLLGWRWAEAARFSFLLAIPAVLGGQALEILKALRSSESLFSHVPLSSYAIGFLTSFIIGLFSVRLIFWIYEKGIVSPFAWYCLFLGSFALWMHHGS